MNVEINCYINKDNEIWFCGKEIALILGYKDTKRAIQKHVDEDDKNKIMDFKDRKSIFITEWGFSSLVISSKMKIAKELKRWVTSDFLPSVVNGTFYKYHKDNDVIETENDLHCKVVSFIRDKYPEALMIAGLGENQRTAALRMESWRKGLQLVSVI